MAATSAEIAQVSPAVAVMLRDADKTTSVEVTSVAEAALNATSTADDKRRSLSVCIVTRGLDTVTSLPDDSTTSASDATTTACMPTT